MMMSRCFADVHMKKLVKIAFLQSNERIFNETWPHPPSQMLEVGRHQRPLSVRAELSAYRSMKVSREIRKKEANDRIVAVQEDAHSWADIKTMDDLGKEFCSELEEFFVNYHRLSGKKYRVLDVKGPGTARKLVQSSRK